MSRGILESSLRTKDIRMYKLRRYVGIPYGYREAAGLDCYQLTVRVLKDVFGIQAPDYEFNGEEDEAWIAFTENKVNWLPGDGSPGDVVLIKIGKWQHCGVCIGSNQMIHTLKGQHSSIEDYTNFKWRDRVLGFYKWPT